jgi:hypothetical protein
VDGVAPALGPDAIEVGCGEGVALACDVHDPAPGSIPSAGCKEDGPAMNRFIVPLGFALAVIISVTLWWFLPAIGEVGEQMKQGGPLVAALILLLILQTAFIIERIWSLKKAQGRGSLPDFLNNVRKALHNGDVDRAIQLCAQQRGSAA